MQPWNVLIVTIGSSGDVHPFVGLGIELRHRGHAVTIYTNPRFEALVRSAGLEFLALGTAEDFERQIRDPDLWHLTRSFRFVAQAGFIDPMRGVYQTIADRSRDGRTIVLHSMLAIGSRVAQEKLGVPTVTVNLSPAAIRSVHRNPVLPGLWMPQGMPKALKHMLYRLGDWVMVDPLLTKPINEFLAGLGLPGVPHVFDNWLHSPTLSLGTWPDWFAPIQPDWPSGFRLTGFPLYDERQQSPMTSDVAGFLEAGEPPIVFTFGSAMILGADLFAASVDLCRNLNRRGVLLTRYREQLPRELPRDVVHFEYAPLSQVLPRAALLVHHGGIGTTAQGLASGVPQVIVPLTHDQFDNASRVVDLNAGRSISRKAYSRAGAAARVLSEVLENRDTRSRCREAAAKCDGPAAVREACDQIEKQMVDPGRAATVMERVS